VGLLEGTSRQHAGRRRGVPCQRGDVRGLCESGRATAQPAPARAGDEAPLTIEPELPHRRVSGAG